MRTARCAHVPSDLSHPLHARALLCPVHDRLVIASSLQITPCAIEIGRAGAVHGLHGGLLLKIHLCNIGVLSLAGVSAVHRV